MGTNDLTAFREGRRRYLGGTDIAAIAGVNPWSSALSVYESKTSQPAEDLSTLPMRRGLALEDFVSDEFTRARPGYVTYRPRPIIRDDWGFPAGASIDRYIARVEKPRTPVAVLECKTAFGFRSGSRWSEETGELPDGYFVQVQWYLAVSGLKLAYAAADTGSSALTIVEVKADEVLHERLIDLGRRFWIDHVEAGVPPEPTGSKADGEILGSLWEGETIPDPPLEIEDIEAERLVCEYLAFEREAKQAKASADEAKQRLQALMGPSEAAIVGDRWRLSWKAQTRTTIDTKRLKADHPELVAQYLKTSSSRTFLAPKEIDS
jgi:putative phage-type endonuclease